MNKSELADAVASSAGITKAEAAKAVDAVMSTITQQLKEGNEVRLVGFGSFVVRTRAARSGRNPANGEALTIPEAKIPAFKAGKPLKDAVN